MNPFELLTVPPNSDLAFGWINILIPLNESAFAKVIAIFSGTLALIGTMVIAWQLIVRILDSAYTGRVTSNRSNNFYAPLRVVLGFALLIPVGDGFSAVHYLLRNVVGVAAIQLGNAPIKYYMEELRTGTPIGIPSSMGSEVVKNVLEKELCIRIHNGLQEYRWLNFSGRHIPEFGVVSSQTDSSWLPWSEQVPQYYFKWDYGPCGSYSFFMGIGDESVGLQSFYLARKNATENIQQLISAKLDSVRLEEYFGKFGVTEPDSMLLDAMIDLGYMVPSIRDIAQTVADWNMTVGNAAGAVYAEENSNRISILQDRITNYGFMAAGAFERHISQISKMTIELSNQSVIVVGPDLDEDVLREVEYAMNMLRKVSIRDSSGDSVPNSSAAITGEYTSLNDLQAEVFAHFVVPEQLRNPDGFVTDPVGTMIQRGHYFIAAAAAAGTTLAIASGFASSLDNDAVGLLSLTTSEALGGTLRYAIGWATWAVLLMFVVGLIHAYVLPMIPFLMVFIMGVSWLVLLLEAAIACVLWAFSLISMNGPEFIGKRQAAGIGLLFNILLRPAVGMLAYIGSLILLPTVLRSLFIIWDGVWDSQQHVDGTLQTASRGITWPFTFIAEYVLLLFLQWHLTIRIFGLVPTIADRVGNWLGSGSSSGYNESGETHSAMSGAVGFGMKSKSAPFKPVQTKTKQK